MWIASQTGFARPEGHAAFLTRSGGPHPNPGKKTAVFSNEWKKFEPDFQGMETGTRYARHQAGAGAGKKKPTKS